jgi:hypothetical protein
MICSKCHSDKDESEFNYKDKKTGKRHSYCRSCQKIMKDEHYRNNKDYYYNRNKKRRDETREWFNEYKSNLSCVECGENHPATLDFHHVDRTQKEYGIAYMVNGYASKEKIIEEIEKCVVLCANCHRKLHWNEKMVPSSNG